MTRFVRLLMCLLLPAMAAAQVPPVQLQTRGTTGTISANGQAVTLTNTGGLAGATVQTLDSYSGTWELQCATDGVTFDTDDEVPLLLLGGTSPTDSVTDTVGIWQANISGCQAVRVIATSGFAASDVTVSIQAITPGGGAGGGGGGGGSVSITQGGNTAAVNASSQLSVTCANCSGSGVSVLEDAASANADAGTPAYAVRNDTVTGATGTDGDYQPLKSDSAGRLYTTGTGGVFPSSQSGTWTVQPGNTANTTAWLVTGTGGTFPVTATNLDVQIGGSDTLTVGNVATIGTSVTPGTSAAHLGKAEDAAVGSGDTGVGVLYQIQATPAASAADGDYGHAKLDALGKQWIAGAYIEDTAHTGADPLVAVAFIRCDSATSSSGTTGDYTIPCVDSTGQVRTNPFPSSPAAGTYIPVRLTDGSNFLTPSSDSTHDSAVGSTGPVTMLEATTALGSDTAVADGDATRAKGDINGRLINVIGCNRESRARGYLANTDGASTALTGLSAPGANLYYEIYSFVVANSSSTDVTVDIRDGAAGSVLTTLPAPATTDTLGGAVINLTVPITFTANTAVAMDTSEAASTVYVTAIGCVVK